KIDPEKYKDLRKSRPWDFTDDKEILQEALNFEFNTIQEAEDMIIHNDLWMLISAYMTVSSLTDNRRLDKELDIQFEEELSKFINE
ncbi:MAG: hypothetical protein HUK17_05640, partial [Bacteroidales bacterium]|nr:hypothetical protein [Bacteroidales bacterium]